MQSLDPRVRHFQEIKAQERRDAIAKAAIAKANPSLSKSQINAIFEAGMRAKANGRKS